MIESLFNTTYLRYTRTEVQNVLGGIDFTFTTDNISVPCCITYLGGLLGRNDGSNQVKASHRMFCSATNTLNTSDKILIGGNYYQPLYVNNARGNHIEVELLILKGQQSG